MPIRGAAFRRRPVALTPLIDVIFLLLLFFMLSSTFTRFAELPLQNAGGGAEPGASPPVFLRLEPDGLSLNGDAVTLDTLPAALSERRPPGETVTLLLAVGEEVSSQRLVDLLVLLRAEPWLAVSVLG
ncbi:MAG: biopolymer transporter ExbD [Roseicyclus sp.]|nr:biopolymer transporter ExbD [Roseicyclus sp.]MBO6921875.1 biopolymer transporter ExbD [Roseicyclus sp.]